MTVTIHALAIALALAAVPALAQQKQQEPPAGRSGLDPASRTKVANVLSRSYIYGDKQSRDMAERNVTNVTDTNGQGGCTTNIGTPTVTEGTQGIGSRYGTSQNDQVVVVRGSVISVCK